MNFDDLGFWRCCEMKFVFHQWEKGVFSGGRWRKTEIYEITGGGAASEEHLALGGVRRKREGSGWGSCRLNHENMLNK
jgi:hypothetical protein